MTNPGHGRPGCLRLVDDRSQHSATLPVSERFRPGRRVAASDLFGPGPKIRSTPGQPALAGKVGALCGRFVRALALQEVLEPSDVPLSLRFQFTGKGAATETNRIPQPGDISSQTVHFISRRPSGRDGLEEGIRMKSISCKFQWRFAGPSLKSALGKQIAKVAIEPGQGSAFCPIRKPLTQ